MTPSPDETPWPLTESPLPGDVSHRCLETDSTGPDRVAAARDRLSPEPIPSLAAADGPGELLAVSYMYEGEPTVIRELAPPAPNPMGAGRRITKIIEGNHQRMHGRVRRGAAAAPCGDGHADPYFRDAKPGFRSFSTPASASARPWLRGRPQGAMFKRAGAREVVGVELDRAPPRAREASRRGRGGAIWPTSMRRAGDEPFDAYLASDVLEPLADPEYVLARAATRLRPGGAVLLSLPNVAASA